jgi:hypothetical protein
MWIFSPLIATVARRAVAALPRRNLDTGARSSLQLQRRGPIVREDDAALAPASPADGRIGEIVLDLAVRIDVPVGQHHRGVEFDVGHLRLVYDNRAE